MVADYTPPREAIPDELIARLPKALLHDHLDGGLRPQTIVELARDLQVSLPTTDAGELETWFHRGAQTGDLPTYLEGFRVTTSVMQSEEALERVASERVEDLIADGVVYAEIRFAPMLHVDRGLNLESVVNAVLRGFASASDSDRKCVVRLIVCGLRNREASSSLEMAELAVDFRDRGVVGFDLAGDESGHPPKRHLDAFQFLRRSNFYITIHAGEAFGLSSIWQAIQFCGAHRIGHATRLYEDFSEESESQGNLANYIRDQRILLEMCLSSNVHSGACDRLEDHPFPKYYDSGFMVTLNTDNILMSATSLSREWAIARDLFGLGLGDFQQLAENAVLGSFCPWPERTQIVKERIRPVYAALAAGG